MFAFFVLGVLAVEGIIARPSANQCVTTTKIIRTINDTYKVDYQRAETFIVRQEHENHKWAQSQVRRAGGPTCPPNPDNCDVTCLLASDLSDDLEASTLIQISKDPHCESQWHAVHVRVTSCAGHQSQAQMMYLPIQVFRTKSTDDVTVVVKDRRL